jgi:membrane protease YdiL (CAAX protease family)
MLVRQRIVFFALSFFALALLSGLTLPLSTVEWKALWIGLCFFGLFAAHRMGPMQSLDELGLCGDIPQGWMVGLLASLPMFVGLAIASKRSIHTSLRVVLVSVLFGPFAEEVLFRGYLFLQLYRRAQWSLPSRV